jgi:serine/threonine-protein kinase
VTLADLTAIGRWVSEVVGWPRISLCRREEPVDRLFAGERQHVGPYRVVERIGVGGLAVVYRAVHLLSREVVAVKVLLPQRRVHPEFRERLRREATALRQIDHPHVVRLLDAGGIESDVESDSYLVLELLETDLASCLAARGPAPLAPAAALAIARDLAGGLAAVHARGLVHRDVKPANVLLRADGSAVLSDFELAIGARDVNADGAARRLTPSNVVAGTAAYLAPEQILGLPLDGRSDLYALGVVLYELLAGTVPFGGRDPLSTLRAHLDEEPPPLGSPVAPPVAAIVDRALRKRPDDRFASAAAMSDALAAAIDEVAADE